MSPRNKAAILEEIFLRMILGIVRGGALVTFKIILKKIPRTFSKMLKSMTADVAVQTSIYTSVNSICPTNSNIFFLETITRDKK